MNDMDYLACDEEVFAMVNNNRRSRPVAVLMPMQRVQSVETFERQMAEYDRRKRQLKEASSVGAPLGIGLIALGAMARDLMSPGLGICVFGACIVWAVMKIWRGGNG